MTIYKCDRCKQEIKDSSGEYFVTLEETVYDYSTGFYVERQSQPLRRQICVTCFKELWGEVF